MVGRNGLTGHAFAWTQTGGMVDLGTLGGTISHPFAVSGGDVVGFSFISGNVASHATLWLLCADGAVTGDEQCDDGNTTDGDGCSASCTIESGYRCGAPPCACGRIPLTVLGKAFTVKDPLPGVDPSRRSVTLLAKEPLSAD